MPQPIKADKNKVEAATKRRKGPFRYNSIREVVLKSADDLVKAISKQNPDVDPDEFEDDLRKLVKRHGGGVVEEPTPVAASAGNNSSKPPYIFAGDVLCLAHQAFAQKNFKEAFRLFAAAMEAEDASVLIEGIGAMNASSSFEEEAAEGEDLSEMPESEEDSELDDELSEIEAEFEGDDEDELLEDEGDEEYEGEEDEDSEEELEEGEDDEEYEEEGEEGDDEELEDESADSGAFEPDAVMAAPLKGSTKENPRLRAIMNKASIDGSNTSRQKAKLFADRITLPTRKAG